MSAPAQGKLKGGHMMLGHAMDAWRIHSDEQILRVMAQEGPPFLFGADRHVQPGDTFKIGDQPFTVTRITSREEFYHWCAERDRRLPVHPTAVTFFEAVTD